jgi:hypothetical protein
MKTIFYTATLVAACLGTSYAQSDTARGNRPLVSPQTQENVREKAQDVRQDVNQAADRAKERIQEEYEVSRSYQERNQLTWFQKGSVMGGATLGLGTGAGGGTYLALAPRVGYFIQQGLMTGLQMSFESRATTSYRATQTGVFLRYYPWRTRISGWGGVSYNIGRERSSNIGADERATYSSVALEIGTMLWIGATLVPNSPLKAIISTRPTHWRAATKAVASASVSTIFSEDPIGKNEWIMDNSPALLTAEAIVYCTLFIPKTL